MRRALALCATWFAMLAVLVAVAAAADGRGGSRDGGFFDTDAGRDAPVWDAVATAAGAKCAAGHAACLAKCCPKGKSCVLVPPSGKHKHAHGRCECAAPRQHCKSACVALDSDPKNCGTCKHACAAGAVCSNGQCVQGCATGQTNCSGACVELASDGLNCGGCGVVCGNDEACGDGVCQTPCATGQNCGGRCVDVNSDPSNCGACGVACGSDPNGHACVAGSCGCQSIADCATAGPCGATGCSSHNVCFSDTTAPCSPAACNGDRFTPASTCGTGPETGMCVAPPSVSCGPCRCAGGTSCDCTCPTNCQQGAVCDFGSGPCCWPSGMSGCSIEGGRNGDQGDCCSGNFCTGDTSSATTGSGSGLCCRPGGVGCSSDAQCCPGYGCSGTGNGAVCCGLKGTSCGGSITCCGALACIGGVCG